MNLAGGYAAGDAPCDDNLDSHGRDKRKTGRPHGWDDCPKMGSAFGNMIPLKVPLGSRFNKEVPATALFTPDDVRHELDMGNVRCDLVIDLTKSGAYYTDMEMANPRVQIQRINIPCHGHGSVPAPEAVNLFIWGMFEYHQAHHQEDYRVLVHCTHGYNRTGFMCVHAAMRLSNHPHLNVADKIAQFAAARPPGIYKGYYIDALFKYYHQQRPASCRTPQLPDWKSGGEPDSPEHDASEDAVAGPMAHDDDLGEHVGDAETAYVLERVMGLTLGPDFPGRRDRFPGSQPVSLTRANLKLLMSKRYRVTWKADGTRYLLYVGRLGTYLVGRGEQLRRVQMRWPLGVAAAAGGGVELQGLMDGWVFDGEMVVDDTEEGLRRRYLIYDLLSVQDHQRVGDLPFVERYKIIEKALLGRNEERRRMARPDARVKWRYDYNAELFAVRRKDFYELEKTGSVLHNLIPKLSHESDGLILQPADDPYAPGTCQELLKWKYSSMNSVDFKFVIKPGIQHGATLEPGDYTLELMYNRGNELETRPLQAVVLPDPEADGGRVRCPVVLDWGSEDPWEYQDKVVECSWADDVRTWVFMRDRKDKQWPNHHRVYDKVMESIQDKLEEEELLQELQTCWQQPIYNMTPRQQAMFWDPKRRKHDFTPFASPVGPPAKKPA